MAGVCGYALFSVLAACDPQFTAESQARQRFQKQVHQIVGIQSPGSEYNLGELSSRIFEPDASSYAKLVVREAESLKYASRECHKAITPDVTIHVVKGGVGSVIAAEVSYSKKAIVFNTTLEQFDFDSGLIHFFHEYFHVLVSPELQAQISSYLYYNTGWNIKLRPGEMFDREYAAHFFEDLIYGGASALSTYKSHSELRALMNKYININCFRELARNYTQEFQSRYH